MAIQEDISLIDRSASQYGGSSYAIEVAEDCRSARREQGCLSVSVTGCAAPLTLLISNSKKYVEIMNGVKIVKEMHASAKPSKVEKTKKKARKRPKNETSHKEDGSVLEATAPSEHGSTSSSMKVSSSTPPPATTSFSTTAVCPRVVRPLGQSTNDPITPRVSEMPELRTPEGARTAQVQISKTIKKKFVPANNMSAPFGAINANQGHVSRATDNSHSGNRTTPQVHTLALVPSRPRSMGPQMQLSRNGRPWH